MHEWPYVSPSWDCVVLMHGPSCVHESKRITMVCSSKLKHLVVSGHDLRRMFAIIVCDCVMLIHQSRCVNGSKRITTQCEVMMDHYDIAPRTLTSMVES